MPETSVGVRWKFSVDSTQRVTAGMDSSAHQRSTSSSFRAPSLYGSRGSMTPCSRAYTRLPSRMMARCRGTDRPRIEERLHSAPRPGCATRSCAWTGGSTTTPSAGPTRASRPGTVPPRCLRLLFDFAEVAESKVSQDFFGDFPPQRRVVQLAVTLPEPSSRNRTDLVRENDGIRRIARGSRG